MINPGLMHLIITVTVLIISYLFSLIINRTIQLRLLKYFNSSNPLVAQPGETILINIGLLRLFFMLYFLVGWPIEMPVDHTSISGRYKYGKLALLYLFESAISIFIAFLSIGLSITIWGFNITDYFIKIGFLDRTKLLPFISNIFQGNSSITVLLALFISFTIFLNILFAVFSLISNLCNFVMLIGREENFRYIEYENEIKLIAFILAAIFLINPLYLFLLKIITGCLNLLVVLFKVV